MIAAIRRWLTAGRTVRDEAVHAAMVGTLWISVETLHVRTRLPADRIRASLRRLERAGRVASCDDRYWVTADSATPQLAAQIDGLDAHAAQVPVDDFALWAAECPDAVRLAHDLPGRADR